MTDDPVESYKSVKTDVDADGERKVYTNLFFQRPLTFTQGAIWVFIHYLTIGLVQGYYVSIQFALQAEGADFNDQSTLSLAVYPYSFKFLVSPLLDRFFVGKLGRSKTYIIIGGLIISASFCFMGPTIQHMVANRNVVPLTVLFTLVNTLVIFVQIAGESWILTMFSKEDKTKAVTFLQIGQSLGSILGYNIFTPLNDKDWLNENIFVDNPIAGPIITHTMMCFFIAILYFG